MSRLVSVLKAAFHMVGGLVLYWIALVAFGIKPAIAVALLFIVIDGGWRLWTRRPFPPLWLIANGAALLFGAIDLWARTPFMIRYEGAIINLGWAAAFALGALGREPLVLGLARQRAKDIPDRPEVVRFFRAFTIAWSLYFVLRALVVLWLMARFPLTHALALRAAFSTISLGVMLAISLSGRRVFMLCRRLGLFRGDAASAPPG